MKRRNPARDLIRGEVPGNIKAAELDYQESTANEVFPQEITRFDRPVSIHYAASWVVNKLARERGLSKGHASALCDLFGIGGRGAA